MTTFEWLNFTGVYGHQEAPESTHWDPGNFDMDRLIGEHMAFTPDEEAALKQLADVTPDLVQFVQAVRRAGSNTGGLADFTIQLHRLLDRLYDPKGDN